jgi:hypothetical protein
VNWFTTNGQSVSLTDPNLLMFGGTEGVLGATASWVLGLIASRHRGLGDHIGAPHQAAPWLHGQAGLGRRR